MINKDDATELAIRLGERLAARKLMLVTAESCTGGGIATVLTSLPDSGQWFERGFVTYSVESKKEMLGVAQEIIDEHGVVSEQTALEMVRGALDRSHASVGVAVTGLAGPDGGPEQKPVGTVCFAWAGDRTVQTSTLLFSGERADVNRQSIHAAIKGLLGLIRNP